MPRIDLDLTQLHGDAHAISSSWRCASAPPTTEVAAAKSALDAAVRAGAIGERHARRWPRVSLQRRRRAAHSSTQRRGFSSDARRARQRLRRASAILRRLVGSARRPPADRAAAGAPRDALRVRARPADEAAHPRLPRRPQHHRPRARADRQRSSRRAWPTGPRAFAHDDDEAARILRDLTTVLGRGRATWIVARPHADQSRSRPRTRRPRRRFRRWTRSTRWRRRRAPCCCPSAGARSATPPGAAKCSACGATRIPDELVLSPDWLATDNAEALLGGDRAWMVDFDAALTNGMAIEVTQAQIEPPPICASAGRSTSPPARSSAWSSSASNGPRTPPTARRDFTDLLAAHRDSTGLGFAALGTPTNNTEAAPSGYSPSDAEAATAARARRQRPKTRTRCSC